MMLNAVYVLPVPVAITKQQPTVLTFGNCLYSSVNCVLLVIPRSHVRCHQKSNPAHQSAFAAI